MKQPYSCWLKVPEGVGWDKKGSPEPNLHVCGEDDTKKAVYNMEECIEKKRIGIRKRVVSKRKPCEIKNLTCFNEKLIVIFVSIYLETFGLIVFLLNLI